MAGRLESKVAVLTGTGRGMARQVALRFAAEGALVVGCDIKADAAQETLEIVRAAGGRMESLHPIDLTVEENAHRLSEFATESFGGIDVLYNSAVGMRMGAVEDLSLADWDYTLRHGLTLPFLVTKHAIPHLRARGSGSIIFLGSMSGLNVGGGYPGNLPWLSAYAVAKAGVIRMAMNLANDLAPINVRVNVISPGSIATPAGLNFYGAEGTESRRVSSMGNLIPRLGQPEDIANAATYLASDEASWVTGHNLGVDGGYAVSGGMGAATPENSEAMAPVVTRFSSPADHWPTTGTR